MSPHLLLPGGLPPAPPAELCFLGQEHLPKDVTLDLRAPWQCKTESAVSCFPLWAAPGAGRVLTAAVSRGGSRVTGAGLSPQLKRPGHLCPLHTSTAMGSPGNLKFWLLSCGASW